MIKKFQGDTGIQAIYVNNSEKCISQHKVWMGYTEVGKQIKTKQFLLRGLDSKILDQKIVIPLPLPSLAKYAPNSNGKWAWHLTVSSITLLHCLQSKFISEAEWGYPGSVKARLYLRSPSASFVSFAAVNYLVSICLQFF